MGLDWTDWTGFLDSHWTGRSQADMDRPLTGDFGIGAASKEKHGVGGAETVEPEGRDVRPAADIVEDAAHA